MTLQVNTLRLYFCIVRGSFCTRAWVWSCAGEQAAFIEVAAEDVAHPGAPSYSGQ
jgi:hypothetical protein